MKVHVYEKDGVWKCTGMKKTGYENERVWNVRIPTQEPLVILKIYAFSSFSDNLLQVLLFFQNIVDNFEIAYKTCSIFVRGAVPSSIQKWNEFKDRSQTLVRGGLMQKIFIVIILWGPLQTAKTNSGPNFFPWKLRVNPLQKHVNSIFNGKSVVIFFQGPPYKGQKF